MRPWGPGLGRWDSTFDGVEVADDALETLQAFLATDGAQRGSRDRA